MFYDLHVNTMLSIGENTLDEVVETAKKLELGGLGIIQYYTLSTPNELPRNEVNLISCLMIKASSPQELEKISRKERNRHEILMVYGGNYEVNRAACENSLIDVLCHPELGRRDSGFDHICARAAKENKVAVEINFREVLESYKKNRIFILSSIKKNIKLCTKYGTPIITTSGAVSKWGMRGGRELAAFAHVLGLDLGHAITSTTTVPEEIIKANREKLANRRWEGVSVE